MAKRRWVEGKRPARAYPEFRNRTRSTSTPTRRVIAKSEHLGEKENRRFVLTIITPEQRRSDALSVDVYCPRGEMSSCIKEQQLYLFADRTSSAAMQANQLRFWLSAAAFFLMNTLRRLALCGTELSGAQCHTIQLKLLKVRDSHSKDRLEGRPQHRKRFPVSR